MPMFSGGIILEQRKEPALSQNIITFLDPRIAEFRTGSDPVRGFDLPGVGKLIRIVHEAEVYDDIAGRSLSESLSECRKKAVAIIVDAVDDEPYVSSRLAPMLQLQEELIAGVQICEHVCGTNNVMVLVYRHLSGIESHIPSRIGDYPVVKLRGGYPVRPSASQIKRLGQGKKLTISVGTAIHLYRAVRLALKQHTSFVTVAGNCVSRPVNMEVSLGITIEQVLERVGMIDRPTHIVNGGPMRGIAVLDPGRTIIVPGTRAVLAFKRSRSQNFAACISCGRCEQICPEGLNPAYVHRHVQKGYYNALKHFDAGLCTGCGTCSYTCPSRQDTAGSMAKAKQITNNR